MHRNIALARVSSIILTVKKFFIWEGLL